MAYVQLLQSNGKKSGQKITHDQAVSILDVLDGRKEPQDDKQATFCEKVVKVYFAWREADPLWIMSNISTITPLALATWAVDSNGKPTRPDSEPSWTFAKKYELWKHNGPYGHAKNIIDRYQLTTRGFK